MSRRKQARPSRLLDDDEETEGGSGGGDLAGGRGCGELATKKTGSGVNNKDTDHNQVLTDKEDANNNESKEKESEDEDEDDDDELMKRENDEKTLVIQNMLSNLQWPAVSPSVTLEALQNTKVAVAQLAANALANNNGENAQDLAVLQSTLFTLQQQQLLQLQLIQQLQHQLHVSNSNSDEDELSLSSPPPPPPPPPTSSSLPGSGGPQGKPENVENHHQQHHHHHHPRSQHPQQSQSTKSGRSNKKPRSKENNVITEDEIIDEEEEGRTKSNSTTTTTTTTTANNNNGLKHNNNNSDGGGGGGSSGGCGLSPAFATLLNCPNQDPNRPLSPGLQSHQINNNHLTQTDVPNTLAMLQRRTEEVLDSASQGLLASSLAADNCSGKKLGPYEKGREPFFKHRCRYCGKVFGSDSALQIHIRSHTGERPFKCNVCGSRFTTKGNLKVHFQRHTSKFPGIKMNSQPIPEHLDHFHPPLLQNNSSNPTTPEHSPQHTPSHQPPPPNPFMHHHAPFFGSLFRFDVKPPSLPFFNGSNNKDAPLSPQDLTKPKSSTVIKKEEEEEIDNGDEDDGREEEEEEDKGDNENGENDEINSPKQEEEEERIRDEQESKDENISTHGDDEDEPENYDEEEQPENLSSKSLPLMYPLPLVARPSRPSSSSASTPTTTTNRSENSPTPMIRFHSHHHHIQQLQHQQQQQQQQQQQHKMMFDPAKDPAIYTNLLPRPGSNDNAWESLIEVTKASETSKLQQLVDNIEHKLTDPNMCVICRRTLSCKSALQMHYRTHTDYETWSSWKIGERPFKCKICGRAFTTKGNLKTHMGVHRAKPPLRVLHQCPVCHKRFTNSLVLQQHIRLHTGEPTDLTPDQIRAAEVKDSYPPFGNPLFGTFSSMSEEEMMMNDDDSASETNESIDSEIKPTTSLAALENQVRTITTTAASNFAATNFSSPKLNSNQNITEDNDSSCSSRGVSPQAPPPPPPLLPPQSSIALDLTPPRSSSSSQIFNPFHHLPPPPLGFPASLLTPTTTANAVAALANLSSFSPLVPPPRPAAQQARGNTTCQICLKTFACNSALEIHYRSHTKERPFKCSLCSRGFSTKVGLTKGNAKQHMLTHKTVRDIPASSNSSFESNKQNGLGQSDDSNKSPPESPKSQHSHNNNHHHHNCINNKRPASPVSPPQPTKKIHEGLPSSSSSNSEDKHLCKVCTKNFSSSSALSIHHRVHSGERPFICNVCGKKFTTKGNLKVHLGTHNQWNGASRRGRRMSLDPMTVFLPHPHHPHHPHPHHQQLSHHPMLGMNTTIKSDLHLPHRPAELFFPFSNTNAQQNIFLQNGSLKSSKESPDEEDSHLDEDEESSKENGDIKSKKVLGSSSGEAEVETIVGGGSGGNDDGRVCIKEEEEEEEA
ncbi:sal-like protein 1 isoform X4 [Folsomia candida]|uniref:sal-like protein 1 isoform X4 n=1 Tax=Folsomia candida TaxID=158441 RepID=UPI00160545D4|nr:sal-like protein 1 isoform X4 [Folsomia candida]